MTDKQAKRSTRTIKTIRTFFIVFVKQNESVLFVCVTIHSFTSQKELPAAESVAGSKKFPESIRVILSQTE